MERDPLELEFECYAAIVSIEEVLLEMSALRPLDLANAVRTVSNGIDTLKKLTDLAIKSQNVELQEGILKLREQMLDLKESLLEAKEENSALLEENKALQEKIKKLEEGAKEKLTLRDGFYYTEEGEGPFCPACYTSKGEKGLVQPGPDVMRVLFKSQCTVCERRFT
jgi:regulator of replication initiation timing